MFTGVSGGALVPRAVVEGRFEKGYWSSRLRGVAGHRHG